MSASRYRKTLLIALLTALPSVPTPTAASATLPSAPFRDALIDRGSFAPRGLAPGYDEYPDGDGHSVRINRGTFTDADAQLVVRQLGALLHGEEMNRLSVLMVTDLEMQLICGPGVLACYDPSAEEMVIAGRDSTEPPPSRAFVIAHEYGHHVATNRSNAPWEALDWGTKRWASEERVCPGVRSGAYKPGAYGRSSYYDNPGEAFAEAFAFRQYPDEVAWEWNLPEPDQAAYEAIEADVVTPWSGPERIDLGGRLKRRGDRDGSRLATPLDGSLTLRLRGPRRAEFDLRLLDRGRKSRKSRKRRIARTRRAGSQEKLDYEICGERRLKVQVVSRGGRGRYEIRARRP